MNRIVKMKRHSSAMGTHALVLSALAMAAPALAQETPPLASESSVQNLLNQMRQTGMIGAAAHESLRRRAGAIVSAGRIEIPDTPAPAPVAAVQSVAALTPVAAPSRGIGALPVADNGAAPPASSSMVVNLMRLLVKQGVISQGAADDLRQEAEISADQARAVAAASAPPGSGPAPLAAGAAPASGVIRVPYIPQVVRNQIREDIKKDVLAQAQSEGWANPKMLPPWLNHVQLFGDLRFRDEFDLYSKNNASQLIDYAAFNNNGPIDINANTNPNGLPFLNTRQNRINQLSIRARFGVKYQPTDWVDLTFRLGSGNDNSPVSNTQLLGGGLTKKNIWLDQAYMTLTRPGLGSLTFGRMPDPFLHTDLLFDDNLEFDGAAAAVEHPLGDSGVKVFATGGAFPLGYVTGAFPANTSTKTPDSTKWLYALQVGGQYKPPKSDLTVSGAVALYDYDNVAGQISTACDIYQGVKQCSTDLSRPAYMHMGNTLFLIRNITPNPNSPNNYAQPQFVGLSYNYREVNAVLNVEAPLFGNVHGELTADYVRNLSYDPHRILSSALLQPVTNFNVSANGGAGAYQSGPNAFNVRASFGNLHPANRGDWNVQFGYKYIQPDALIDAFNNNDYHMGGTNSKGYYIIANYYIAKNTWIDGRWYSASEVYGPPLAIDVMQLELQTRF